MPILLFKSRQCKGIVFERNWRTTLKGAETLEENFLYIPLIYIFLLFLHFSHIPNLFWHRIYFSSYIYYVRLSALSSIDFSSIQLARDVKVVQMRVGLPDSQAWDTSVPVSSELNQSWHTRCANSVVMPVSLSVISLSETLNTMTFLPAKESQTPWTARVEGDLWVILSKVLDWIPTSRCFNQTTRREKERKKKALLRW